MQNSNSNLNATIIGGGIAGLTAALRLAERGFSVTIFEKGPLMGGNLSAVQRNGVYYDVYPHMFAEWYHNFWNLAKDVGLYREQNFERRSECAFLRQNEFPHYHICTDIGAFSTGIRNLSSGVLTLPEMFLANYAILDALVRSGDFLENQTVHDFIVNRPYATRSVTQFFSEAIKNIWSVDSYLSSASAYQSFAKYQFREPSPLCWVLKDDSYNSLIKPLCDKLKALNCSIRNNTEVTGVTVRGGRIVEISCDQKGEPEKGNVVVEVDNLIIAATPDSLGNLVFTKASEQPGAKTIVSLLPQLANVRRLGSDPLPVLYVSFRRILPNIPPYYVALMESKYSVTFVQIKQLTERQRRTVMAIAASDFDALPVRLRQELTRARAVNLTGVMQPHSPKSHEELKQAAIPILNEFRRYVPINLDEDVDWDNTFFHPNLDQQLFINQVGSQQWCTEICYPTIPNLYFAGNTCANPIAIATVESGVYSGLQAARAVVEQYRVGAKLDPVPIIEPKAYPTLLLFAWKIMLSPYAALAKLWVEANTVGKDATAAGSGLGVIAGARAASLMWRDAAAAVTECGKMAESLFRQIMR